MWFVVYVKDYFDFFVKCMVVWLEYLVCLNVLQVEGWLLLVGLFLVIVFEDLGLVGFIGSLIIVEFVSQVDVEVWVGVDLYVVVGVYVEVEVKLFCKILL